MTTATTHAYPSNLSDVRGLEAAKRALEVAAAGGHPILLFGPPGSGKHLLARFLPDLLPPMSDQEAAEVADVWRHVDGRDIPTGRPFRSPHPGISATGFLGGGQRPGEVSLAHAGVLFLDELPEISRASLEAALDAHHEGQSRLWNGPTYPARFHLIAAMTPCPCGHRGDPRHPCRCSDDLRSRFFRRARPFLDRADILAEAVVPSLPELRVRPGERSEEIARRVSAARQIQAERSGGLNTDLSPADLDRHAGLDRDARRLYDLAVERLDLPADVGIRIRKVGRTIADLDGCPTVQARHIGEAIQYRTTVS